MLESSLINMKIRRNILGGAKIPHSTSQPVIFCENNKYYLAVFVFFYTREDIQSGMIGRPAVWAIADMETGEIINEYRCREKDFSDADFEKNIMCVQIRSMILQKHIMKLHSRFWTLSEVI